MTSTIRFVSSVSNPEPGTYLWAARRADEPDFTYYRTKEGTTSSSASSFYPGYVETPKKTSRKRIRLSRDQEEKESHTLDLVRAATRTAKSGRETNLAIHQPVCSVDRAFPTAWGDIGDESDTDSNIDDMLS